MQRSYSLAYLTAFDCTPPQAIALAAELGYAAVGLRLLPNAPGAPQQHLIGQPQVLRETQAAQRDTGVAVFDLEIIRIGPDFDPQQYLPLMDAAASLGGKALLVAADDANMARLADSYARLCAVAHSWGLTADLEFMPWTAVKDARSALSVVQAAGSPVNAGILVDALHFGRSDTTLDDIRTLPRHLLHYAQICDASTAAQLGRAFTTEEMIHTARSERLLPGEGAIDVRGLFAALPPDIAISVEIPSMQRVAEMGSREWARRCLGASQALLSQRASPTQPA